MCCRWVIVYYVDIVDMSEVKDTEALGKSVEQLVKERLEQIEKEKDKVLQATSGGPMRGKGVIPGKGKGYHPYQSHPGWHWNTGYASGLGELPSAAWQHHQRQMEYNQKMQLQQQQQNQQKLQREQNLKFQLEIEKIKMEKEKKVARDLAEKKLEDEKKDEELKLQKEMVKLLMEELVGRRQVGGGGTAAPIFLSGEYPVRGWWAFSMAWGWLLMSWTFTLWGLQHSGGTVGADHQSLIGQWLGTGTCAGGHYGADWMWPTIGSSVLGRNVDGSGALWGHGMGFVFGFCTEGAAYGGKGGGGLGTSPGCGVDRIPPWLVAPNCIHPLAFYHCSRPHVFSGRILLLRGGDVEVNPGPQVGGDWGSVDYALQKDLFDLLWKFFNQPPPSVDAFASRWNALCPIWWDKQKDAFTFFWGGWGLVEDESAVQLVW